MSDYEDYGDDEIDYDPDAVGDVDDNNEDGINLEDNFIEAEHSTDPISAYKTVIELEISNSSDHKWSYKSYEKLCQLYIKAANFEEFKTSLDKLFELYPKVDDFDKQDTIRNITFTLTDVKDFKLKEQIFQEMLTQLKDKELERPYMDTGLQWSKLLFGMNKYEELGTLVPDLMDYLSRLPEDEIYKSMKLELLVMQIQLCKVDNKLSEIKELYLDATKIMQDQIFDDKRLSGIINEEGGKIDLRNFEYDKALQKFKFAFHNYEEAGNNQAAVVLKYAFLASMITRNRSIIVSPDEAKVYPNDQSLKAMVELYMAYEAMDINLINKIWNEKIKSKEKDPFILENLNELLHNIRLNYISNKLQAYNICKFDTLIKELGIDKETLIGMVMQLAKDFGVKLKVDLLNGYIEMKTQKDNSYSDLVSNFNGWLNLFK